MFSVFCVVWICLYFWPQILASLVSEGQHTVLEHLGMFFVNQITNKEQNLHYFPSICVLVCITNKLWWQNARHLCTQEISHSCPCLTSASISIRDTGQPSQSTHQPVLTSLVLMIHASHFWRKGVDCEVDSSVVFFLLLLKFLGSFRISFTFRNHPEEHAISGF